MTRGLHKDFFVILGRVFCASQRLTIRDNSESLESLESVFVWQNVKERGGEDVVAKIEFIIVKKQY